MCKKCLADEEISCECKKANRQCNIEEDGFDYDYGSIHGFHLIGICCKNCSCVIEG